MKRKLNLLITDSENRSALAATRSLGSKGHNIFNSSIHRNCLSSRSRFSKLGISVNNPLINGDAYVSDILSIIEQYKIDIVFPMTEHSIYLLNPIRQNFPPDTLLACPPDKIMGEVSNKFKLFKLAENLKIDIPHTLYLQSASDLPKITRQIENYPVVIKPAFSRVLTANSVLSGGIKYASNKNELEKIYTDSPILNYPSLIQEKIEGPGTGLFTLYDRNKHLALFSHIRLREKPPSGGVSVVSQSVPLDDEMIDAADRLLAAVSFSGVAMVEFKRDKRDGKAKLMEINSRFWGTLQLAIASGIDFPSLYLDYLLEKNLEPTSKNYKFEHKMKWFLGTLDHLIIRLKNPDSSLNLPVGAPSKLKAVYEFLKVWERNTSFDVFHLKDIGPFLHECSEYAKNIRGSQ